MAWSWKSGWRSLLLGVSLGGLMSLVSTSAKEILVGDVVEIDTKKLQMTIVPATGGAPLTVQVGPGDGVGHYLGRSIQGELVGQADKRRLERIWPNDAESMRTIEHVNNRLRRDTVTRGFNPVRGMGEPVPPFALWNQNAELIQPDALRRRPWVLNFVFTRCTVPHMCPAATRAMVALQQAAREAGVEDLVLVTISFDPEYDTPGVLHAYGSSYSADFTNYHFLTGDKAAIDDLMRQFGIIRVEEDGTINHTMDTVLVDRNGRIVFRRPGSRWSADEFIRKIKELP